MDQPDGPHAEDRKLVEKLAKLQSMHQQITDLRGLLPERLLRPTQMALENPRNVSPERLSASLRKAVVDGSNDIQKFKKSFLSPEMRELWQKSADADTSQGRDAWTVDYQALLKGSAPKDEVSSIKVNGSAGNTTASTEDESVVIKQYQTPESVLKIETADGQSPYPLTVTIDGLRFLLTHKELGDRKVLVLEHESGRDAFDLEQEIVRNVNQNSSSGLATVLSMLASYHNYQFQTCNKCKNTFDDDMRLPLARQHKTSTDSNNNKFEWEVLHANCIR